jgi:hypothetical protein
VLTHFSPSLTAPLEFEPFATRVFSNTTVGQDHLTFELRFGAEVGSAP